MRTENKYNWMTWAIIILALMNIATIVTVLYQKNRAEAVENSFSKSETGSENASVNYSGRYFRDQLSLDNDQMSKFMAINPTFRGSIRDINRKLNHTRQEMFSLMAAGEADTAKLNALSDTIGVLHANLKKETYRYYLDLKNICDTEQQKKLEELFRGMFVSESQMGQNGNAGQQGRRRGRPFNN